LCVLTQKADCAAADIHNTWFYSVVRNNKILSAYQTTKGRATARVFPLDNATDFKHHALRQKPTTEQRYDHERIRHAKKWRQEMAYYL